MQPYVLFERYRAARGITGLHFGNHGGFELLGGGAGGR